MDDQKSPAAGKGTGAATQPAQRVNDETHDSKRSESADETDFTKPTAFAPFRDWVNKQIQRKGEVRILFAGENCLVTELTPAGELRLERAEGPVHLVPFDETYIQGLLIQLWD